MNRLRVMLIAAALMTGGSALASAQVYDRGGKEYRNSDRDRDKDRDKHFKRSYDRDDRGRHFDNDRGYRDRDRYDRDRHDRDRYDRDRRKRDRDDYRKYERRDRDHYHGS